MYDDTQQCHIDVTEEQDADTDCFFDATEDFYENLEENLEEVAACTAHQTETTDSTPTLFFESGNNNPYQHIVKQACIRHHLKF
ncbi:hypothetical protein PsalMR5_00571 [Piscirickettsia salmonis]|uniref:hypothetical protein n=1 Tax=Piscirickettsia salmonis TaxID=1238 RepID=UPI0012BAA125|nr:hypothetical protein [Piscirickettsia salmonis]QGP53164.1 hypothetical protein PsalSR1_00570 [Piscirickettsia salmonis]QGP60899.1 hypothetical protein PsalBI1_03521 [Piscirickettsia salmonis]QGP62733.1 hypothetical protein PsalMR5_00571 [Piscirickettsia salmonis]